MKVPNKDHQEGEGEAKSKEQRKEPVKTHEGGRQIDHTSHSFK